jgi:TPR repeat protein
MRFTSVRLMVLGGLAALIAAPGCTRSGASAPETAASVTASPYIYKRVVALCIGIDRYRAPGIPALSFAERDAQEFANLLQSHYGYKPELFLGKKATKAAIDAKLEEYAAKLGEKDVLLVYFAGHGNVIDLPSYGRAGYLIPYDARLDLDEPGDPATWSDQALDMRQLVAFVNEPRMRAHHVLLILDTCCSGFMTKRGNSHGNFAEQADLQVIQAQRSRMVLAAATERQSATEDRNARHGYFTNALLDVLKSPEATSVTDVFREVRKRVVKDSNMQMQPQMGNVGDGDGEFVFLPLQIPKKDIQLALEGGLEQARRRVAQRTTLNDLIEVFNTTDYRFTADPGERERIWRQKFHRFQENAAISDVRAMAALVYCYTRGLGVDQKDEDEAYRWARLAYSTGAAEGKHVLAECLRAGGTGVAKNEHAAERLFHEAAAGGFPLSKYTVHLKTFRKLQSQAAGASVAFQPGELEQTLQDSREAADAGVFEAQRALAILYLVGGAGVEKDPKKAIDRLKVYAGQGSPSAQGQLAKIFKTGIPDVVALDPKEFASHARAAAENGDASAQALLAWAYHDGDGVPKDYDEARKWAELAGHQGEPDALTCLFHLYYMGLGVPKSPKVAISYLEMGEALESPRAICLLGLMYLSGQHDRRDVDKGLSLLRRAGQMGDADGWFIAGRYYKLKYQEECDKFEEEAADLLRGLPGGRMGMGGMGGPILPDDRPEDSFFAVEATVCFLKAARLGHEGARKALTRKPFDQPKLLKKAEDQIRVEQWGTGLDTEDDPELPAKPRPGEDAAPRLKPAEKAPGAQVPPPGPHP